MDESKQPEAEATISDEELKMPDEPFLKSDFTEKTPHSYLGVILAVLIVILCILLGGLYLWSTTLTTAPATESVTRPTAENNNEPESTNAEADVETTQAVSTSNDLGVIEADLESTNLTELDSGLADIDSELNTDITTQ